MEQLKYRCWEIEYNQEANRRIYGKLEIGAGVSCDCSYCRNFALSREEVYPKEVLGLLSKLGIDYRKDAEVWDVPSDEEGIRIIGGWFHCVGNVLSGQNLDSVQIIKPKWYQIFSNEVKIVNDHYENIDDLFSIHLGKNDTPLKTQFQDQPIIQIAFQTKIPWLLDEPPEPGPNP